MPPPDLVLASASPRRRALLERMGLHLRLAPVAVDETPADGERPADLARRLARAKGTAAQALLPAADAGLPILGADTLVVVDARILGKPGSEAEARAMLMLLAGRRHDVLTGTWVCRGAAPPLERVVATSVTFRLLDPAEIDAYLATEEWRDKAGGYAIQGIAAAFATEIRGSFTNVIGLPLAETLADLRAVGGLPDWPPAAFGADPRAPGAAP